MSSEPSANEVERVRVAVIGAGFGGLALAHRLAQDGIDDVAIFERSDGVGGTWRTNTYPGAACDVPSHLYSLSFAPNPDWSRTYATQPEILAYVEKTYADLGHRGKVRCRTTVTGARWDEVDSTWVLQGDDATLCRADVLVSAVGLFHTPAWPDIAGLDTFAGAVFHSARWRDDIPLDDRRVTVVGTGASAIQIVPAIAPAVGHLDLYQRTPAWIMPRADEPFSAEERQAFAHDPDHARRYREAIYDLYETTTSFLEGDPSVDLLTDVGLQHLEGAVADPALRARLTPDYPIGCKRVLVSSTFYPAVQRDDVELITDGIERVTPEGIVGGDGVLRGCDVIVVCTGFRATEYLRGIEVVGRGGTRLHDAWAGTPSAYHGAMVPGFPSFFMMYGPNTNQGGNSILLILEAQAQMVADALATQEATGRSCLEVSRPAMERYEAELTEAMSRTVWHSGCDSYFRTAAGDVVTQLPHPSSWYRAAVAHLDPDDLEPAPPEGAGHTNRGT